MLVSTLHVVHDCIYFYFPLFPFIPPDFTHYESRIAYTNLANAANGSYGFLSVLLNNTQNGMVEWRWPMVRAWTVHI